MLQIFSKLEPVKLNSECKAVRCESVGNRSRRREGIRFRVWQWDPRGGREREGFTLKKEEVDKWDHGDKGVENERTRWNSITVVVDLSNMVPYG